MGSSIYASLQEYLLAKLPQQAYNAGRALWNHCSS